MNPEEEVLHLLRGVLGMGVGERWVLREMHLPVPCTVHRYEEGWFVLIDYAHDRLGWVNALLGWRFFNEQDMADFLTGALGRRIRNFAWVGERIEP